MTEERFQRIMTYLEEDKEMPQYMPVLEEAIEIIWKVRAVYKEAHLIVLREGQYITISDKGLGYLLERLEREHMDCVRTAKRYERDIEGIRGLLGRSDGLNYYSDGCLLPGRREQ